MKQQNQTRNDYYVYVHRRKDNREVFYVGKGRDRRAYCGASGKNPTWKLINQQSGGHTVEILEDSLKNKEAIDLENYLLTYPPFNWKLVNIKKAEYNRDIDAVVWSDYFYYDETSPTCLRWKVPNRVRHPSSKRAAGDIAGTLFNPENLSRPTIQVNGHIQFAHRVIWKMFNPGADMNELVINHIDNDPSNNKISNLELVTQGENARKSKLFTKGIPNANNTSGYNGVSEVSRINRNRTSIVLSAVFQWYDEFGKRRNKTFSYIKYGGKDKAMELALDYMRKEKTRIASLKK